MNTIVVPTDFSAAAVNATNYAALLATKLQASVVLLHVYQLPVPMADFPVLMVTNEDMKKATDDGLQRALEEARTAHPGVSFETESRLGDVATEVDEACRQRNAFALVVGAKDTGGFERFLFGDTTVSLIKHCSTPVIAVPEGTAAAAPTNVVLATDLRDLEEIPSSKIVSIIGQLKVTLHVVHVEIGGEQIVAPESLMRRLEGTNATYHVVREDDVTEGLKRYVERNNINLVLVLPHKHNLYERLFFKGHTKGILHAMPVPVMSLRNE